MSFTDQLLAELVVYGVPLLFAVVAIASAGAPFPVSLTLVAAGSFARQGEMGVLPVILAGSAAAVLGDQIGYGLSRWGGHRLVDSITRKLGGASKIKKAEGIAKKWGGPGIFFSRWLVTGLGPWINVASGIAGYPWRSFIFWDVLGEVLWVVLYVMLGYIFSDRVQYIAEILGNLAWAIVALIVAMFLGWKLFRSSRPARSITAQTAGILSDSTP
jgi:membrane protein DedA with SNARE-associated domain